MDYRDDPVRDYLNGVIEAKAEVKRLHRKIAQLEAQATNVTSQLSDMPKGNGADRNAVLAALADASGDYYKKLVACEQYELEVSRFIDSLPSAESRIILRLRYLEGKRWPAVLTALEKEYKELSERQMFRLHGKALNEARQRYSK